MERTSCLRSLNNQTLKIGEMSRVDLVNVQNCDLTDQTGIPMHILSFLLISEAILPLS